MRKPIAFTRAQKCDLLRARPTFEEMFDVLCSDRAATAAVWLEHGRENHYTYEEFRGRVLQCAARIRDARVAEAGSWVALCAENSPDWPVLFWALLAAGLKPLPLPVSAPPRLKNRLLTLAGAAAVICNDSRGLLPALRRCTPQELTRGPFSRGFEPRWSNRIALCSADCCHVYVYDGRAVCRQVIDLIECHAGRTLTREELGSQRSLCLLPFSDSFALLGSVITAPLMGFVPLFAQGRTAEALFAQGRRLKAEQICASPAQLNAFLCPAAARQALLPAPRRRPLESAARFSLFLQRLLPEAGMSIARHTLNEWPARRLLGTACRQVTLCGGSPAPDALRYAVSLGYGIAYACGCTESGVTLYDGSMEPDARLAPCSGRPLGEAVCRVSEEGELIITGPVLCTGTLADGFLTPLPMGGGKPFSTGKKAHFDARGRLHITGGIPRGTRV